MPEEKKQQPHRLCLIVGEGKTADFVDIGVAWKTKAGDGFTFDVPAGMMVTGRLAILPRKEKSEG